MASVGRLWVSQRKEGERKSTSLLLMCLWTCTVLFSTSIREMRLERWYPCWKGPNSLPEGQQSYQNCFVGLHFKSRVDEDAWGVLVNGILCRPLSFSRRCRLVTPGFFLPFLCKTQSRGEQFFYLLLKCSHHCRITWEQFEAWNTIFNWN